MNSKMKSFVKGILLGLVSRAEFPQGKEPVAYLYNGVRLPKLPEWDRVAYPYAFISNEVLNSVVFHALAKCPYNNGSPTSKGTICNPYDEAIPLVQCFLSADGNSWGYLVTGSLGTAGQISEPFWANFDVLYQDGTLSLAASEPTQVYE